MAFRSESGNLHSTYIIPISQICKLDFKSVRILVMAKGSFLSDRTALDQYIFNTILTHVKYAQNVEVSFEPRQQSSSNGRCNEGEVVNLFCDIAGVCYC